jgi:hypothetical protein
MGEASGWGSIKHTKVDNERQIAAGRSQYVSLVMEQAEYYIGASIELTSEWRRGKYQ